MIRTKTAVLLFSIISLSLFLLISAYSEVEIPEITRKERGDFVKNEHLKFQKVDINQFIEPEVCAACHEEIYEQWNGSMHNKSFLDPLWRAATKYFSSEARTIDEVLESQMCIKCHVPLGFRSFLLTSPEADFDKVPDIVKAGIFCNWCHNISEVKHLGNAAYEVSPGGGKELPSTMLGPFDDSQSTYHPTKFSKLHTQSEFCALCHNVSHVANDLPIEKTYDEWKESPYNTGNPDTTVHCQDCHMRQTPTVPATGKTERPDNPGTACDTGPQRPHISTHYIVGGNTIVGKDFSDEIHVQMAIDRLKHAADVEIIRSGRYRVNSMANIKVKVINSGAGHYLPTGMTEIRQMWLEVKALDKTGRLIFHSGSVDEDGNIDPDAVMYHTILGNSKGEPVMNLTLADRVLFDHRIPPKGYVLEGYTFFIPGYIQEPIHIEAVLRYRSSSQSFANSLLKEGAPRIPIVDMAQAAMDISLSED